MSKALDNLADPGRAKRRSDSEVHGIASLSRALPVARNLPLKIDEGMNENREEVYETMKRFWSVALVVAVVLVLAGEGIAQMAGPPYGPMYGRMGPGAMGGGMMGRGMMGGQAGGWNCPGLAAGGAAEAGLVTEDKAKELAQQYADQYLKGFTVERVLPFTGMRGTMYSVELKGPEGQVRTFHVNPWGNVMPFGGPGRRAG